jgi:hypothetical protein
MTMLHETQNFLHQRMFLYLHMFNIGVFKHQMIKGFWKLIQQLQFYKFNELEQL